MRYMAILLLLCALLSLGGKLPFDAWEMGILEPVELLIAESAEGGVLLRTEKGHRGWGKDFVDACADVQNTSGGQVLLSTVRSLVLVGDVPVPDAILRPATAVYSAWGVDDPKALGEYLQNRMGSVTLGMLWEGEAIPPRLLPGEKGLYLPPWAE
ncbi:MAG: hypothetical protein J6K84_00965 [Oscillospiraceae bacterium]|nr:hypothetical protein [Oscillospiraceae bacterium]